MSDLLRDPTEMLSPEDREVHDDALRLYGQSFIRVLDGKAEVIPNDEVFVYSATPEQMGLRRWTAMEVGRSQDCVALGDPSALRLGSDPATLHRQPLTHHRRPGPA